MKQIHVVAGVIRDARGRILLARRTEGRDLAGLWEFPGGKVEPGEAPEAALARELHEELGIQASVGAGLIRVPQQYPDKRLLLDVREVTYRGTPKGLDGQALVWSPADTLARYAMPAADRPVVAALLQPDRYLVTPAPEDGDGWLASLAHALARGIRRVQLRAAGRHAPRWRDLAGKAVAACRDAGAEVLVNADLALARQLGVGVHLRASQLGEPGIEARLSWFRSAGQRVGASCHDVVELRRAQELGCDFVVLGPVLRTTSHPDAEGIGWEGFAGMREQASLPIYALGGLGVEDIGIARDHGAQGIAAIRGLWALS